MAYFQLLESNSSIYRSPESAIQEGIDEAKMTVVAENAGQVPPSPGRQQAARNSTWSGSIGLWVFIIVVACLALWVMPGRD